MVKDGYTEEQIVAASERLGVLFLASDAYKEAKTIYGYLPYNQEVRTVPMLQQALLEGKKVAVPKCYGDEMRFIFMDDLSKVEKGYANIPEPIADEPIADDETALVLMPGLAFDPHGYRVGYGGGYYDRFLAEYTGTSIGICYEDFIGDIVTEEYDLPVKIVVTEEKIRYIH